MANELYHILGLDSDAGEKEIRKAYFRLVRLHTPEKDPEGFQAIRAAYETLKDPKARANYDSLQVHGEEIDQLTEEADQYLEEGNFQMAAKTYKRILELSPKLDGTLNRLGLCYLGLEQWDSGEKVFKHLTKANPNVPLYWSNYGELLLRKGEQLDESTFFEQAIRVFLRAKELEPRSSKHYVKIAACYFANDEFEEALQWLDDAIHADNQIDEDDLEIFRLKTLAHLSMDDFDLIPQVAQELKVSKGDDPEFMNRAARYFASQATYDLEAGNFSSSLALAEVAQALDESDQPIKHLCDTLLILGMAEREFDELEDDPDIVYPLVRLAALNLIVHTGDAKDPGQIFQDIILSLLGDRCRGLASSLSHLKSTYPWTMKNNEKAWETVFELMRIWQEVDRLINDSQVLTPIKGLAIDSVFLYFGAPTSEHEARKLLNDLATSPLYYIYSGAVRIRDSYKLIYKINPGLYDGLIRNSRQSTYSSPSSTQYAQQGSGSTGPTAGQYGASGCMLPILFFIAIITVFSLV